MTQATKHTISRRVGLTAVLVSSVLIASPAQAWKARSINDRQVAKQRLTQKSQVIRKGLRRLTRPLRKQRAPIKLNWAPRSPSDFNIIGLVKAFQAQVPRRIQRKMDRASTTALAKAHSVSFTQRVDDGLGRGPKRAAVHITRGTVNMPLASLLGKLPIEQWGVKLDHYLGGEVKIYQRDAKGRPMTQVERMVLSALPGNLNIRALNMDMSKVEKKEVVRDSAGRVKKVTMFWRVHDSANRTTIMDVGSIAFEAQGGKTLMTFHSAHRLGKNGLQLPNLLVKPTLRGFFSDHLRRYRKLATAQP